MKAKLALVLAVTIIAFEALVIVNGQDYCSKDPITRTSCGIDCPGRPRCGGNKRCGNIPDVCYCNCAQFAKFVCRPTELGLKWNDGATNPDGTYRFDGHSGDGKAYDC